MKSLNTLPTLVLVLVLIGCSSSQPATTGSPTPAERDTTTAAETTEAQTSSSSDTTATQDKSAALSAAPQDWYRLGENSRHAPGLATQSAHETMLADRSPRDTVTVAIIDSGIDVDHEDLDGSMWRNGDEVPGNETDDDNNGYVDDVRGWNFIGGPDGENVDEDTYELTRIYARLRDRFADVDSGKVAPEARDAYQRFQEIKATFQEKRQQAEKELTNVRKARDAVQFSEKVLSNYLGTKTITRAAVDTISTSRQKVVRARDILLYFYRQDLAPEDLYDYYDHLKTRVEYNYDPDFTPRSIVGDNYADKTERIYGNNDVVGPDANHGTHVSGIVAAERNNGVGIDGVASGVRLLPVRAVPNGDERDKDVANAIRYAVDNGADVINMSFGKAYSPHKDVVDDAVRYADSLGVLMVHAAGNDGENVDSTQNYPTRQYRDGGSASLWIEVGASSWKQEPNLAAPFSNYGNETVDVFAPGHSIYSTVPDGEYGRNDGTSMAAPMVSGVAALIMAHYPDLTAAQVREIILDTATSYANVEVTRPGSSDDTVRFGRLSRTGSIVNARDALERAGQMTDATTSTR
ncbi:MAG: peptidase S8 [Bacteroidetes bacterium QH_7_62_13]|nr:MAG: peptidase S8 [Bacteroidetes bacterium QH_7_62_13]